MKRSFWILLVALAMITACAQAEAKSVPTRIPRKLPDPTKFAQPEKTPAPCYAPAIVADELKHNTNWSVWQEDINPVDLGRGWYLVRDSKDKVSLFFSKAGQADGGIYKGQSGRLQKDESTRISLWVDGDGIHGFLYVFQCPDGSLKYNKDFLWTIFSQPVATPTREDPI
ncbi:hypothetical protein HY407_01850 [Candidatus Gottesmanbacteria bacterium]|nr:hypothetical protein [Candidatus Gottesmanbacteria bacterium]